MILSPGVYVLVSKRSPVRFPSFSPYSVALRYGINIEGLWISNDGASDVNCNYAVGKYTISLSKPMYEDAQVHTAVPHMDSFALPVTLDCR